MKPIPADVLDVQRATSDPGVSAWVSANAGSGKTHVLAQRVIRLLLAGNAPAKILCLTYTKAAAANMANRVFETLGAWTALDDEDLDDRLREIEGRRPDSTRRTRARRLFAQALETPGGLKVQTIHAFCTRLLHQFPFEADVAARFEVLEERARSELIDRLRLAVLLDAAANRESRLGRALAHAISVAADQTFKEVIDELIGRRDALAAWIAAAGSVDAAIAELAAALGVDPADGAEAVERAIVEGPNFAVADWPDAAARIARGGKQDGEQAERLLSASRTSGRLQIESYLACFFTANGPRKRLVTAAIALAEPVLADALAAEQHRLEALLVRRRAIALRDRSAALITIAAEVMHRYAREKARRGLLDYDDLIEKSLQLLDRVDAAWVHYKLDLGIDHVLIDEAQDTSPKQWEIVAKLTAEFTAGAGARGLARSIFAVGDEKQSIFSFQGAVPRKFADMGRQLGRLHLEAELTFVQKRFQYSFRSGENVLGAVDEVFRAPAVHAGVTTDAAGIPPHIALRSAAPGEVEVWPLIEPEEKRELEGWDAPFDTVAETSPRVQLARRVARHVRIWLDRGDQVGEGAERRAVTPGDILVLVRQRGSLFEAIIRALKDARVAVAGADRLILTEHIAVMDLMALGDALLLPDDDLALATVLRSPLFGFSDEQLYEVAAERKTSLRTALRQKGNDLLFADAAERLDRYAGWARHQAPFAFYARILGRERGRLRLLSRLGLEAADALDEFLEFALAYEQRETPSLQGFLAWLRAGSTEVKRDMDIARDEVRVMTVHGAKGLEAPIVILADTTTTPKGPKEPRLLSLPAARAAPGTPDRLVWAGRKDADVAATAQARAQAVQEAEQEHRRLLYVAMTRAADRLVLCGAAGQNRQPAGCWYEIVHGALVASQNRHVREEPADDGQGNVWRWRKVQVALELSLVDGAPKPGASPSLPDWLARDAPAEPGARTISPSEAFRATPALLTGEAQRLALARGTLVHRLLQALPELPHERRAAAARAHLARAARELAAQEREAMVGEVMAVLDHSGLAALFGPFSRAEVPIVGRLPRTGGTPILVSGQVDRLAVTDAEVLIADYKTNREVPRALGEVPAYVRQLALYRAVLASLYPGRRMRAVLVWTYVPDLMELSATDLDAALHAVTSP